MKREIAFLASLAVMGTLAYGCSSKSTTGGTGGGAASATHAAASTGKGSSTSGPTTGPSTGAETGPVSSSASSSGSGGAGVGGGGVGGGMSGAACDPPANSPSNGACYMVMGTGGAGGGASTDCNPVTSVECTTAGDGCDTVDNGMTFECLPMATEAICAACDEVNGPYCAPGLTCLPTGDCARYCCDDGDCGTGKCDKTILDPAAAVGVCVK